MNNLKMLTILGWNVTVYGVIVTALCIFFAAALAINLIKKGKKLFPIFGFVCTAAIFGLLLGRAVFCAVRFVSMFYDPMGRFSGISAFFRISMGSLCVIGVVVGVIFAAFPGAKMLKMSVSSLLDEMVLPGLLLFALIRFAEPFSGQGYGSSVIHPLLCRVPLGIMNDWGEWFFSVCFLEGALLLAMAIGLRVLRCKKPGSKALLALVLIAGCQLLPESLRRDNALRIFVFVRVNQLGYAVMFLIGAVMAWIKGKKQGLSGKKIGLEAAGVLMGMLLLMAGEYALDKTAWPDMGIYLAMLAVNIGILFVVLHRIFVEDRRMKKAIDNQASL